MTAPTPAQAARITQLHAEAADLLAALVERHRAARQHGDAAGLAVAAELRRRPPALRTLALQVAVAELDAAGWTHAP